MKKFKIGDWVEVSDEQRKYCKCEKYVQVISVGNVYFFENNQIIGFKSNRGTTEGIKNGTTPYWLVNDNYTFKLAKKCVTKLGKILYKE